MKYKYVVKVIPIDDLEQFLNSDSWELISAIPVQSMRPGLSIDRRPIIEFQFHCIFKITIHEKLTN